MGYSMGGSSPRMWGTRIPACFGSFFCRFIPTYVGNSQGVAEDFFGVAVHPHVCGELLAQPKEHVPGGGSSPRMWGTPTLGLSKKAPPRFIPTYVGNSCQLRLPKY